jgi:formylglycine-generating enzyme required for sulfatase activity
MTTSCCDSVPVPGGSFHRNYDVAADKQFPDMTHQATVSAFRLDVYKVTVGRFRRFVDAGMGTQAKPPASGAGARTLNGLPDQGGWEATWNAMLAADTTALLSRLNSCNVLKNTWTNSPGSKENRPMVCVSWYEAMAFCIWDGGFLPTDAQRQFAAAAGNQQRAYPWSNPPGSTAIDCTLTSYGGSSYPTTACATAPVDVGSVPGDIGAFGQRGLGGNVSEWILDFYQDPLPPTCNDCARLSGTQRVLRASSFYDNELAARIAWTAAAVPDFRGLQIGLRCARAP